MSAFILTTGDKAFFRPNFGKAIVIARPGDLVGTGRARVNGKPVCVAGDEKKVIVPGCAYTTPQHLIPGMGMLQIESLGKDQKAKKTKSAGKAVLLKGSTFKAKFTVLVPAQQLNPPGPPVPDTTTQYKGNGQFITLNRKVKGT